MRRIIGQKESDLEGSVETCVFNSRNKVSAEALRGFEIGNEAVPELVERSPIVVGRVHVRIKWFFYEFVDVLRVFFKVRLPLLEEGREACVPQIAPQVGEGVSPLKHVSALNHSLESAWKELNLLPRIVHGFVQHFARDFNLR